MERKSAYNIIKVLEKQVELHPDQVALSFKGKEITYSELWRSIEAKARELKLKGIGKGDRVLVFVPFSIELYISIQAIFYIGAVAVFVDQWVNLKRLNVCCQLAKCKGFIYNYKTAFLRLVSKGIRNIPVKVSARIKLSKARLFVEDMDKKDEALITFTTGSTGIPKAAIRTHGILEAQFNSLSDKIGSNASSKSFIGLPIVVLCELGVGANVCLENIKVKDLNAKEVIKQEQFLEDNDVEVILHSPFYLRALCEKSSRKLPNVKRILTGGAPVYPKDAQMISEKFPNAEFTIVFGSTEAEPISSVQSVELVENEQNLKEDGLLVGAIHPICQLRIVKRHSGSIKVLNRAAFDELCMQPGEVGEIVVAGHHVVEHYVDNEKAFEENKILVGNTIWHRTGDAGRLINNKLYLMGRQKQLFEVNNQLVSPFISEYLLSHFHGLKEGTILQKRDGIFAYVVPIKAQNTSKLQAELKSKFTYLDEVVFLKKLPKDPRHNSKIDYGKLQ
ncbi:MAG: AMP-binding protein [Flavobacteriales bacterium]|nr:AMP-binding protein [Flavobacteriales bacterium]